MDRRLSGVIPAHPTWAAVEWSLSFRHRDSVLPICAGYFDGLAIEMAGSAWAHGAIVRALL